MRGGATRRRGNLLHQVTNGTAIACDGCHCEERSDVAIYCTKQRAAQPIAPSLRELSAQPTEGVTAPTQAWQSVRSGAPPTTTRRGGACSSRLLGRPPHPFSGKTLHFTIQPNALKTAGFGRRKPLPYGWWSAVRRIELTATLAEVRQLPQSATPTAPSKRALWAVPFVTWHNRLPRRCRAPPRNDNRGVPQWHS